MTADEEVCTDDDDDVAIETYVDEAVDILEDSAVTELDTVGGVDESVQFVTFITLSSTGVRVMIQVSVTSPLGLEEKEISDDIIPKNLARHTN